MWWIGCRSLEWCSMWVWKSNEFDEIICGRRVIGGSQLIISKGEWVNRSFYSHKLRMFDTSFVVVVNQKLVWKVYRAQLFFTTSFFFLLLVDFDPWLCCNSLISSMSFSQVNSLFSNPIIYSFLHPNTAQSTLLSSSFQLN